MGFIDTDFPQLLGAELYRPKPEYISKYVIRPRVVWEALKGPGDTMQLDRFHYWADDDANGNYESSLTKSARQRSTVQTIGIGDSKDLKKDKIMLYLQEFTGPSSQNNPNSPSTFQIPVKTILTAQRNLYQLGQKSFHDSIGSSNLLDDYRRWDDRCYINELLKTTYVYNPDQVADGGSYDLNDYGGKPPRWTIENSDYVVARMSARNAPKFEDGNYWCLCSPDFMLHLQRDAEFREVTRYQGSNSIFTSQMLPGSQPGFEQINVNASAYTAGIMQGQATNINGMSTMPTGLAYRGIRYFVSNNLPKASVTLTYTNNGSFTAGPTARNGELGIFFGPEAIAVALGGDGPTIKVNNNDDFGRFVIAIWHCFADWQLADERFVTVGRSFTN